MRFRVPEGEIMPRLWGVAWYNAMKAEAIVLPVPLNLVAGAIYRVWWAIKRGLAPDQVHMALRSAHHNLALARAYQEMNIGLHRKVDDLDKNLRVAVNLLNSEVEQTLELKRQLAVIKDEQIKPRKEKAA